MLLAMSVLSLCVEIATIMSAEKGARSAHSAKLGLRGLRVSEIFIFPSDTLLKIVFKGWILRKVWIFFNLVRLPTSCGR